MFGVWGNKSERATSRRASTESNSPFGTSQPRKGKGGEVKTENIKKLRLRTMHRRIGRTQRRDRMGVSRDMT